METEEEYPFHIYIIAGGLFQIQSAQGITYGHHHRKVGFIIRTLYCLVWHDTHYHRGQGRVVY